MLSHRFCEKPVPTFSRDALVPRKSPFVIVVRKETNKGSATTMEPVETRISVAISSGIMAGLKWCAGDPASAAPALVFLHANGFCASTYRALLSGLAKTTGKCVVALDLRGHGRSQLPANPDYQDNWNRHARDIAEALAILAPQGAVLAGHSMGGTSALLASARVPHLVTGMCLFDPVLAPIGFYFYAKLPWVFENWRKNFPLARGAGKRRAVFASRAVAVQAYSGRGAFKSWPAQTISDYCDDGFTDLPDGSITLSCAPAFEAACFAGQRHNPHAAMRAINWPARLLRGERGSTTVGLLTNKLERNGVTVDTIAGTSHFLPMERPLVCQEAMADIMAQAGRTRAAALAA
jgi:pimeloyl-ACP methyl ester carboxylesterase